MKDIVSIINESRTNLLNIEKYAKSWVTEYQPQMFSQILNSLFKGLKSGLEENSKYCKEEIDKKEIENSLKIINKLEEAKK